jgi:hypothetical protein
MFSKDVAGQSHHASFGNHTPMHSARHSRGEPVPCGRSFNGCRDETGSGRRAAWRMGIEEGQRQHGISSYCLPIQRNEIAGGDLAAKRISDGGCEKLSHGAWGRVADGELVRSGVRRRAACDVIGTGTAGLCLLVCSRDELTLLPLKAVAKWRRTERRASSHQDGFASDDCQKPNVASRTTHYDP